MNLEEMKMYELNMGSKTLSLETPQDVADEVSKLRYTCFGRGRFTVEIGHSDHYRTIGFKSSDSPEKIESLIRSELANGGLITMEDCYPGGCP
jgi:hypothetical protein